MSTHYTTEPPPTASVTLHTTAGPIALSLFTAQTPLTSRNFLQHALDGYYDGVLFHRVAAGFVVQTGDPTGTGEGGESIYDLYEEDGSYDRAWARVMGREEGERIGLGDEMHGRLRFNRRGMVGMAKQGDGGYGSQFFVTLGDVRAELDGKCTMFGRVEGEGIYNLVKISEGEVDGERPVFPERILRVEVTQMPEGEAWSGMRARVREEKRVVEKEKGQQKNKKKVAKKPKKTLLSFGEDEEEEEAGTAVKPKKAKFNTALIEGGNVVEEPKTNAYAARKADEPPPTKKRKPSVSPPRREKLLASMTAQLPPQSRSPEAKKPRKPSFHDTTTQLPLRDEEMPSRSASPDSPVDTKGPSKSSLEAEIAALKASMRRDTAPVATKNKKLSALEAMIPATSTRGRKRTRPGEMNQREDKNALAFLNAFKARLDSAKDIDMPDADSSSVAKESKRLTGLTIESTDGAHADAHDDDEEAPVCDLHFIANCQSCSRWDEHFDEKDDGDADDSTWMSHKLAFGRDQLGKDLNFKKRNEALEELVVIDPREKAGQILAAEREKQRQVKEARQRR